MSPLARLIADPRRFSFDAAIRILAARRAASGRQHFRASGGAAFPAAEVVAVEADAAGASITTTLIGLTGPSGTLPAHITDAVVTAGRRRSPSFGAFLDMLSERMVAAFGGAGIKYRPHRDADHPASGVPIADALLALTGQYTRGIVERLPTGPEPFRHYAGLFADVPAFVLGQGSALDPLGAAPPDPRLGWNTWLPTSAGPAALADADEPVFEAA